MLLRCPPLLLIFAMHTRVCVHVRCVLCVCERKSQGRELVLFPLHLELVMSWKFCNPNQ